MTERPVGERIAEARKRKGLSQRELAALMDRSESWVSQVERGVMPVDRLALLQKLGEVLETSFLAVEQEAGADGTYPTPVDHDLEQLRNVLTGHPSISTLFGDEPEPIDFEQLRDDIDHAWEQARNTNFTRLAEVLPKLELAARGTNSQPEILGLLARSYQAAAAGFARQDEGGAAWIAADRAVRCAEASGDPLQVAASHFRLAHTLIRTRRNDQAERAATTAADALRPAVEAGTASIEHQSLLGAMLLVLAALAGFERDRTRARTYLDEADTIAEQVGDGRNDYDTEFGPTNVAIHRVSIAVDLGDAGEAIDTAATINASALSSERQMRLRLDTARAHIQRREPELALADLLAGELAAPENMRSHRLAHQAVSDLLGILPAPPESDLAGLAVRTGVIR
ncbi:MAG: helix-turn-helix domain-containing protein [Actinomycetota bacterium]